MHANTHLTIDRSTLAVFGTIKATAIVPILKKYIAAFWYTPVLQEISATTATIFVVVIANSNGEATKRKTDARAAHNAAYNVIYGASAF